MASSIWDRLADQQRQQPAFQTRQALIILGLQEGFVHQDGILPVINPSRLLKRIGSLVPAFRSNGDVYWVRTQNKAKDTKLVAHSRNSVILTNTTDTATHALDEHSDRADSMLADDDSTPRQRDDSHALATGRQDLLSQASKPQSGRDPENYLAPGADSEKRCCDPQKPGYAYVAAVESMQSPQDTHMVKSDYSAFNGTSLLLTLRARLVTEVYLAGCMSNLCVYATALEAAQHGIQINIVQDCLGYRSVSRHNEAVNRMVEDMGASITTSDTIIARLDDSVFAARSSKPSPRQDRAVAQTPRPDFEEAYLAPESEPASDPEDHISDSFRPPLASIVVPKYRASSRSPVHAGQSPHTDQKWNTALFINLHAVRSIEQIDKHAMTEQWRKSCSPSDELTHHLESAYAIPLPPSSASSSKEPTPALSDPASKKRRSADLEDVPPAARREPPHAPDLLPDEQTADGPALKRSKRLPSLANLSMKRPGDSIGAGDTTITDSLLSMPDADAAFLSLLAEIPWQTMSHASGAVPRLICCQGTFDQEGFMPVYRHPSDTSPPLLHWTPTVARLRRLAERHTGHPLNHALIQLYRSGHDHITEHSDKTLDLVEGSQIVNLSLGAQRVMRLRSKRPASTAKLGKERITERIPLPHGSVLSMGPKTNAAFLHAIQPDRRLPHDLSASEAAFGGMRVSITFRQVGTFLTSDGKRIFGRGALAKDLSEARDTVSGDKMASEGLLKGFGAENQATTAEWRDWYGEGSDVLHLHSDHAEKPMLFLTGDEREDQAIQQFLDWAGVVSEFDLFPAPDVHSRQEIHNLAGQALALKKPEIRFRDTDKSRTEIQGLSAVMQYLALYHVPAQQGRATDRRQIAREMYLFSRLEMLVRSVQTRDVELLRDLFGSLDAELERRTLEGSGNGEEWLADSMPSAVDFAYRPLVEGGLLLLGRGDEYASLRAWVRSMSRVVLGVE